MTSVRPLPVDEVASYDHETDVLVVGFGCAGAAAAYEAATAGADVLVLERAAGSGGSAAMSGGEIYLGGGTSVQKACGFEDSAQDMYAFLMSALGPEADEEKVHAYCDGSLEHFDWLVERGVTFNPTLWDTPTWMPHTEDGLMWMGENSWPYNGLARPAPRGHRPATGSYGGWLFMDKLSTAASVAGARTHTDTRATRLVVDDRGVVVGAVARRYGEEVRYLARRGVVLTTGGFVDNEDMLRQHAPQLLGHGKVSGGGDDGSGIRMAAVIGAATRRMAAAQVALSVIPQMIARGMIVNAHGQRFINEDTYPGLVSQAAVLRQDGPAWVILDEEAYESVPEHERWGVRPQHVTATLAELEEATGMPSGALDATVTTYNRFAGQGRDPYFHKAARWLRPLRSPFAAVDTRLGFQPQERGGASTGAAVFTLGGLYTTLTGEVLDASGAIIRGLFAAGRATSGLHGGGYISGTSLGDGTFFGRSAGRSAAAG